MSAGEVGGRVVIWIQGLAYATVAGMAMLGGDRLVGPEVFGMFWVQVALTGYLVGVFFLLVALPKGQR